MARTPASTVPQIEISHVYLLDMGRVVHIDAGNRGTERIVPPAGEKYAFERKLWGRSVEVYVSPTGRSVRVFVDGREVKKP